LELDKPSLTFKFAENNHEMFTHEVLTITNDGNAAGKFQWEYKEDRIFTVEPKVG
jgi:hypothetical protein